MDGQRAHAIAIFLRRNSTVGKSRTISENWSDQGKRKKKEESSSLCMIRLWKWIDPSNKAIPLTMISLCSEYDRRIPDLLNFEFCQHNRLSLFLYSQRLLIYFRIYGRAYPSKILEKKTVILRLFCFSNVLNFGSKIYFVSCTLYL